MTDKTKLQDETKPSLFDRTPTWAKVVAAAALGAGATVSGDRIANDSPIHFAVEGEKPAGADAEWVCEPEGGIIGAPMVCRPKESVVQAIKAWKAEPQAEATSAATSAAADTFVGTGHPAR